MPQKLARVALTVVSYMAVTFGVQGASHFAVNADYYAGIAIMRHEPIIAMGLAAMVIQGLIFAWLFPTFNRGPNPVRNGILFSCTLGAFLASYVLLGEAGKYSIPSISAWIAIEGSFAAVQFILFGALLGLLHRRTESVQSAYAAA